MVNDMRVSPEELTAILVTEREDTGYRFHRVQDGYSDGIPRAVFVHADEDPVGIPLIGMLGSLMLLVGRLAADLRDVREKTALSDERAQEITEALCVADDERGSFSGRDMENVKAALLRVAAGNYEIAPLTPYVRR
jgi:hypothetical protein